MSKRANTKPVRSKFYDVTVYGDDAPLAQIEFVGDALYFVIDSTRMAKREDGQWVSIVPGFDIEDLPDVLH